MPNYKVRLVNQDIGLDSTIEVPDSEYILDIAEDENIRLPFGFGSRSWGKPPRLRCLTIWVQTRKLLCLRSKNSQWTS